MKQFLPLLTIAIVIVLGVFVYNQRKSPPVTNPIVTSPPTSTPVTKPTGGIEGSLSYPSEIIPEDLAVCAENVASDSAQPICTSEHLSSTKYTYTVGYKLTKIPVGTYYVYAKVPSLDQKAYYNEFVTCGLKAECESHKPIEVEVKADEVVQKIDPQDWYVQPKK